MHQTSHNRTWQQKWKGHSQIFTTKGEGDTLGRNLGQQIWEHPLWGRKVSRAESWGTAKINACRHGQNKAGTVSVLRNIRFCHQFMLERKPDSKRKLLETETRLSIPGTLRINARESLADRRGGVLWKMISENTKMQRVKQIMCWKSRPVELWGWDWGWKQTYISETRKWLQRQALFWVIQNMTPPTEEVTLSLELGNLVWPISS